MKGEQMKLKKIMAIGLTLTITIACLPIVVPADMIPSYDTSTIAESSLFYAVEGGNIYYTEHGSNAFITDADTTITKANIPNEINGLTVALINRSAFAQCHDLTEVTIPDGVTNIDSNAFEDCSSLKEIIIPNKVRNIGDNAFSGCSSLTEITISASVLTIGAGAFSQCNNLKAINVADENENFRSINGVLFDKTADILYAVPGSFISYEIPNNVHIMGSGAFSGCQNLTEVIIPNSVQYISDYAFDSCSSLADITIPDSVTSIGNFAFADCSKLTSITIPNSVTYIGNFAFYGCNSLSEVTILNNVTFIIDSSFYSCNMLEKVYCYKGSTADNYSLYPEGVTIVYLDDMPVVPEGLGDVDGDGVITSNDAAKAYVLAAAKEYDVKADVDGNKAVEAKDAEEIMNKVLRASYKFPLEQSTI